MYLLRERKKEDRFKNSDAAALGWGGVERSRMIKKYKKESALFALQHFVDSSLAAKKYFSTMFTFEQIYMCVCVYVE